MAEKYNATCSICGNEYYACMSCKDAMKLHPWKIHCCSADCYKVFQVVRGFSTNVYTKDEFRSKLKNLNLDNLENYREHIKTLIKDVLKEDSVGTAQDVKLIEDIKIIEKTEDGISTVENMVVENSEVVDKIEAIKDIVNPITSRKRNYKVEVE